MRLIDADKIDTRPRGNNSQWTMWRNIKEIIDKAPTVPTLEICKDCSSKAYENGFEAGVEASKREANNAIVRCKDCKHRDPEDRKCDCGGVERQGCTLPVSDDYFCMFGEERGDA